MAGTSFTPNEFRIIPQSHGKRRETSITILPQEIIFMILVLLPAEMLWNVARYVCREWCVLIQDPQFGSTHDLSSTSTLLRHTSSFDLDVYQLLDVGDWDVKLTDFKFQLPVRVCVRSTCNGLLLMEDTIWKRYYVGNPLTGRILALPKLSSFMRPISICCSLAFEDSSKLYKVVVVFDDLRLASKTRESHHFECAILTVGVDKAWRVLNLTHLEKKDESMGFLLNKQIAFSGLIYWVSEYDPHGFALDIKSEIINPIQVPHVSFEIGHFLPRGNSISFVVSAPDLSMEVLVLKDHKREKWVNFSYVTGELMRNQWKTFLSHNNLRTSVDPNYLLNPECWLGNGEKILFSMAKCVALDFTTNSSDSFFSYGHFVVLDLITRVCFAVDTKHDEYRDFVPFIPSLAWV